MRLFFTFCFIIAGVALIAQPDEQLLHDLFLPEEPTIDYASAAFKTNRVINLHSIENTAGGVLDLKIQHRFGAINGGAYTLWGLDQATMRLGFDYGVSKNLQIGFGRSTYEKLYDGYFKYRLLRQSSGKRVVPVTVSILGTAAYKTVRWNNSEVDYKNVHRAYYVWQAIIGRKFNNHFSFQVSPTVVHRNLVANRSIDHDIYVLGLAGRIKLTNRVALTAEYTPVVAGRLAPGYRDGLSVSFDIETGGHVFQLQFSNSLAMVEKGFLTEVARDPSGSQMVHFGFNLSRVFTVTQNGRL
jgi:hypothetical protein